MYKVSWCNKDLPYRHNHIGDAEPAGSAINLIARFGIAGMNARVDKPLKLSVKFRRGKRQSVPGYNTFSLLSLTPPTECFLECATSHYLFLMQHENRMCL